MTLKQALDFAMKQLNGDDSASLDSEVLLSHVLQKNRTYLRTWPEKELTTEQQQSFYKLIASRQQGQPVAYLTGLREFWSRPFIVSSDVLIPRPDTELLIEIIQQKFSADQSLTILDMGTGSGAIAVTLALEFHHAQVTAIDSSKAALKIAQQNAQQLGATNINFIYSHWFDNIKPQTFDIIVSNPPYICKLDPHLVEGDVRFEPNSALVSSQQGLSDIEHICKQAKSFLKAEGILLFEHGYQQGNPVKNLLELAGFTSVEQFHDIQDHTRATLGQ